MRIAYIDPFSGASGDMLLGALFAAGLEPDLLRMELAKLPLPEIEITVGPTSRHGISGLHAEVAPEAGHHARSWRDIRAMISESHLHVQDKERALEVFSSLAHAEATVHGETVEEVHFHEVGALDTIVDIVGVVAGLRLLGVERVFSGPVHVGGGVVRAAHGVMPVPAPATALLMARFGIPIAEPFEEEESVGELLTPTGAALLGTLATFVRPAFTPKATGCGFGTKQMPWPNLLRITLGDKSTPSQSTGEDLITLQTNIDDMNPQFYAVLADRLFAAGALDVWSTPIQMKKQRQGQSVSILARTMDQDALVNLLIEQSTTLGVRITPCSRIAAERSFETVATRWGDVSIKLKVWNGRVLDIAPEYDDCLVIAQVNDIGIRAIWNEAYRLGEVYIGRRVDAFDNLVRMDPLA